MICPKCKHEFKDPARVKGGQMGGRKTIKPEEQDKMQAGRENPKKDLEQKKV
jgi:hypothetical protein